MFSRRHIPALAILPLASIAYVWKFVQDSTRPQAASWDFYSQAYPTMIQAVAAIRDGGRGLLWNALQNCGQPFFGSGITGLLYPGNLGFFVTDPDHALYAMLAFNFVVACVSAYFLCLELRVGALAACCGGLCFGLGASSVSFATAAPLLGVPYVWFPAAMLFCERILRTPSLISMGGLAVTIALTLIPGHPQLVFYLLQMIGARFVWELVTRRHGVSWRTVATLLGGLVLGPLLIAVQLVPAFEVARESIRGRALAVDELAGGGFLTWELIRNQLAWRWDNGQPFLILPCMLAAVAWLHVPGRRIVLFYALVGVLALDLALGNNGFLFALYSKLPFVSFFRLPARMMTITSFGLAVLAAAGVEAMVGRSSRRSRKTPLLVAALLFAALLGMRWLIPNRLAPAEWGLGIAVLVAGSVSVARGEVRLVMGTAIIAALLLHLVYFRGVPLRQLLPDGSILFAHRSLYAALQQQMNAQDRTYVVPPPNDHRLQQKTGALFGVPAIYDYHPQTSQRFADYFSTLRTGSVAGDFIDWSYPVSGLLPKTLNKRLLNLAAGRFVLVPSTVNLKNRVLRLFQFDYDLSSTKVHIYQNRNALPRAFFVPQVEIVSDPALLLQRLAHGNDDLRQIALVEAAPASGFMGAALPSSDATVEFVRNDPEHIILQVRTPARGFVFLADQYFPGWYASVNDAPTPIDRANYVFRLVEVPAGESSVVLWYSPWSLKLGGIISVVSWLLVFALLLHGWRHPPDPATPLPEGVAMR